MPENDTYKTLQGTAEGYYTDKRSRFLSFAHHVRTAEEALSLVADYRKRYHDARHVCWAYRLGAEGADYRYNDDGEPHSTAGKPIYGQLLSSALTDVVVVVVRYYGGINLGTGGLVVAYREAAAAAIAAATIEERLIEETIEYSFPYTMMDRVMKIVRDEQLRIVGQSYGNTCTLLLAVRRRAATAVRRRLANLSFS